MVDVFVFVGRSSLNHHTTWRAQHEIARAGRPFGMPRRRQKNRCGSVSRSRNMSVSSARRNCCGP
jgi:hypothetical protein